MASIKCTECGCEMGDTTDTCPACGAVVKTAGQGEFFIATGSESEGPYTADQLRMMLAEGGITEDTPCSRAGMESWKTVKEMLNEPAPAPKPPPARTPPAPPVQPAGETPRASAPGTAKRVKQCPFCTGEVPEVAVKCMHCGSSLGSVMTGSPKSTPAPLLVALLSGCCIAGLGQMVLGQILKGIVLILVCIIVAALTGGIGGFVLWPLMAIDAYMVATAMRKGKPVGPWDFFPSA